MGFRMPIAIAGCLAFLCPFPSARLARGRAQGHSYVLWVREVRGKTLYWVNDKPWGRAPLSGIVAATGSEQHIALTVVLDARVPIQEIGEIQGLMAQLDIGNVHYYVYEPADPGAGMSEIMWKTESVPLPKSPPVASAH